MASTVNEVILDKDPFGSFRETRDVSDFTCVV